MWQHNAYASSSKLPRLKVKTVLDEMSSFKPLGYVLYKKTEMNFPSSLPEICKTN